MIKIDKIDKQILEILQKNANIPLTELSKRLGISKTPCWNRIKKLEEEKVISNKVIILDNKKVNLPLLAFLSIQIPNHSEQWLTNFTELIKNYNQIIETHRINGNHDYILKILSPSMEEYDKFQQKFIKETGCINMKTSFSQKEIKNTKSIPLNFL